MAQIIEFKPKPVRDINQLEIDLAFIEECCVELYNIDPIYMANILEYLLEQF